MCVSVERDCFGEIETVKMYRVSVCVYRERERDSECVERYREI